MIIRKLVQQDAEQYRSLMLQAYDNHPDAFGSSYAERAAEPMSWWQSRLSPACDAQEMVVGAFSSDQLVGVSGVAFGTQEKTRHKARIFGMYVNGEHRGTKVGSRLLRAAISLACDRKNITIIQLTVTEGNDAARRLYESVGGFASYGLEPYALKINGSYVSKVHMWRELKTA